MKISFQNLGEADFPLLLKWLEEPHVKAWWDSDIKWTLDLIRHKYTSYTQGYKLEDGVRKSIFSCIILVDGVPAGYIQLYNAYDFSRSVPLDGLPQHLAAFDVFIGEKQFLNKGLGSSAIDQFLNNFASSYTHVFADPEKTNIAAIRTYEKAGFIAIAHQPVLNEIWMIRTQSKNC